MLSASTTKKCVLCGQKITLPFVALLDNTFIHSQCLAQVEASEADFSIDEDLKFFHQYILNLKMVCSKCNNLIDGTVLKKWGNTVGNKHICAVCSLGKVEQQIKVQTCDLCDSEIHLDNTVKSEMKIEGINICKACFEGQDKAVNKVQLEEKPDFGVKKQKNIFENMIKFEMPQVNRFGNLFGQQCHRKNLVNLQNENKLKKEKEKNKITCCMCYQKLKLSEFSLRDETGSVCKKCYKKTHSNKKIEHVPIQTTEQCCTFGIDMLFFESLQIVDQKNQASKKIKVEENQLIDILEVTDEHKYSEKECKICFNGQSKMMNIQCRHLMMCEKCYKKMELRNNNKDKLPCPVCQTMGKYMKYIEPIYI